MSEVTTKMVLHLGTQTQEICFLNSNLPDGPIGVDIVSCGARSANGKYFSHA